VTHDGLLIDFGGVMTTNVFESFAAFCRAEGLDPDTVKDRFRNDPAARDLLGALEEGRLTNADFEARFAAMLGVADHVGLIARLFGGMQQDAAMFDAVAAARRAGIRTGLVSNSWGEEGYDRTRFAELFDAVVISGEVGLHKPQPQIFALAAERVELDPSRCVFVDDLRENCEGAEAVGMTAVLHRDTDKTLARLEQLLEMSLR
jgi:putative hydrolase of the HAD superfamily